MKSFGYSNFVPFHFLFFFLFSGSSLVVSTIGHNLFVDDFSPFIGTNPPAPPIADITASLVNTVRKEAEVTGRGDNDATQDASVVHRNATEVAVDELTNGTNRAALVEGNVYAKDGTFLVEDATSTGSTTILHDVPAKNKSNTTNSTAGELVFDNPLLKPAYHAIQSWKSAIMSDPHNFTGNWVGSDVCSYNGIICAELPDDPANSTAVAGIDFNGADLQGELPIDLGVMEDIAMIHINSNRFTGRIPKSILKLKKLYELDLSNNHFTGAFPKELLDLPNLKYLDLRFNDFDGPLPSELFDKDLDALFLNNNRFNSSLPDNVGNSKVSVMVLANNDFHGCVPRSIGKMAATLDEIILTNNSLGGCLPMELKRLRNVTVLDLSNNSFTGVLPKDTFKKLKSLEVLNIANNSLTGVLPDAVCKLRSLTNFTYSNNYFKGEESSCKAMMQMSDVFVDDKNNCFPNKQRQRSADECKNVVNRPIDCGASKCGHSGKSSSYHDALVSRPSPRDVNSPSPPSISLRPPSLSPSIEKRRKRRPIWIPLPLPPPPPEEHLMSPQLH